MRKDSRGNRGCGSTGGFPRLTGRTKLRVLQTPGIIGGMSRGHGGCVAAHGRIEASDRRCGEITKEGGLDSVCSFAFVSKTSLDV